MGDSNILLASRRGVDPRKLDFRSNSNKELLILNIKDNKASRIVPGSTEVQERHERKGSMRPVSDGGEALSPMPLPSQRDSDREAQSPHAARSLRALAIPTASKRSLHGDSVLICSTNSHAA